MRFRKKPVVIEAEQFFVYKKPYPEGVYQHTLSGDANTIGGALIEFRINTLEGFHIVSNGDWIITGVEGERYPCKPGIFDKTYEKVEE